MLSKLKNYAIAVLAACTGLLTLALGWYRGREKKRRVEALKREYNRAVSEKENEVYVKKIKYRRAADDLNRMFGKERTDDSPKDS